MAGPNSVIDTSAKIALMTNLDLHKGKKHSAWLWPPIVKCQAQYNHSDRRFPAVNHS